MIRTITCTECPNGCQVTVELEKDQIKNITGFICPRGKAYAQNEIIAPRRVLTTTVKLADGRILPVKTDAPILKVNIFNAMKTVNGLSVKAPVEIGQILYENIEDNINLVATATIN